MSHISCEEDFNAIINENYYYYNEQNMNRNAMTTMKRAHSMTLTTDKNYDNVFDSSRYADQDIFQLTDYFVNLGNYIDRLTHELDGESNEMKAFKTRQLIDKLANRHQDLLTYSRDRIRKECEDVGITELMRRYPFLRHSPICPEEYTSSPSNSLSLLSAAAAEAEQDPPLPNFTITKAPQTNPVTDMIKEYKEMKAKADAEEEKELPPKKRRRLV